MSLQEVLDALSDFSRMFTSVNQLVGNVTPLYRAFADEEYDIARTLIECHGADLNVELGTPAQVTSVYAIERVQTVSMVQYCVEHGACYESIVRLLRNRLNIHASSASKAIVVYLLDAGYRAFIDERCIPAWAMRFIHMRNAEKRCIATVIGLRGKSPLLRSVGRDVVQLIARAMWAEREALIE